MSRVALSALDWAKALPRGARVPWDELEAHVVGDHPELLKLLGPAGADVRRPSRWVAILLGLVVIIACVLGAAVVWAPIWGLASLLGDAFGIEDVDGRATIPIAGASILVSIGVQLVLLARLAAGRGGTSGIGGGTAILATLVLIGIVVVGIRQDVPGWQGWAIAAAAAALLGVVVEIGERRQHRRRSDAPVAGVAATPADTEPPSDRLERERRIDDAVRALPDGERDRLLDERRRALEWLRMKGTITPDEAARAQHAPLGRLGSAM